MNRIKKRIPLTLLLAVLLPDSVQTIAGYYRNNENNSNNNNINGEDNQRKDGETAARTQESESLYCHPSCGDQYFSCNYPSGSVQSCQAHCQDTLAVNVDVNNNNNDLVLCGLVATQVCRELCTPCSSASSSSLTSRCSQCTRDTIKLYNNMFLFMDNRDGGSVTPLGDILYLNHVWSPNHCNGQLSCEIDWNTFGMGIPLKQNCAAVRGIWYHVVVCTSCQQEESTAAATGFWTNMFKEKISKTTTSCTGRPICLAASCDFLDNHKETTCNSLLQNLPPGIGHLVADPNNEDRAQTSCQIVSMEFQPRGYRESYACHFAGNYGAGGGGMESLSSPTDKNDNGQFAALLFILSVCFGVLLLIGAVLWFCCRQTKTRLGGFEMGPGNDGNHMDCTKGNVGYCDDDIATSAEMHALSPRRTMGTMVSDDDDDYFSKRLDGRQQQHGQQTNMTTRLGDNHYAIEEEKSPFQIS